jgi:hypothetical protein
MPAYPQATLPGPSRTITVEPLEVTREDAPDPPAEIPERPPAEPAPQPEPEREPVAP